MRSVSKRGMTPVIATVLLILITIVLAVVIYFFFSSLIGEKISKNGGNIEDSCSEVDLNVNAVIQTQKINVINRGTVPVVGIKISKEKFIGEIANIGSLSGGEPIAPGATASIEMGEIANSLEQGDTLLITPVLYGEKDSGERTPYVCGKDHTIEVEVL